MVYLCRPETLSQNSVNLYVPGILEQRLLTYLFINTNRKLHYLKLFKVA